MVGGNNISFSNKNSTGSAAMNKDDNKNNSNNSIEQSVQNWSPFKSTATAHGSYESRKNSVSTIRNVTNEDIHNEPSQQNVVSTVNSNNESSGSSAFRSLPTAAATHNIFLNSQNLSSNVSLSSHQARKSQRMGTSQAPFENNANSNSTTQKQNSISNSSSCYKLVRPFQDAFNSNKLKFKSSLQSNNTIRKTTSSTNLHLPRKPSSSTSTHFLNTSTSSSRFKKLSTIRPSMSMSGASSTNSMSSFNFNSNKTNNSNNSSSKPKNTASTSLINNGDTNIKNDSIFSFNNNNKQQSIFNFSNNNSNNSSNSQNIGTNHGKNFLHKSNIFQKNPYFANNTATSIFSQEYTNDSSSNMETSHSTSRIFNSNAINNNPLVPDTPCKQLPSRFTFCFNPSSTVSSKSTIFNSNNIPNSIESSRRLFSAGANMSPSPLSTHPVKNAHSTLKKSSRFLNFDDNVINPKNTKNNGNIDTTPETIVTEDHESRSIHDEPHNTYGPASPIVSPSSSNKQIRDYLTKQQQQTSNSTSTTFGDKLNIENNDLENDSDDSITNSRSISTSNSTSLSNSNGNIINKRKRRQQHMDIDQEMGFDDVDEPYPQSHTHEIPIITRSIFHSKSSGYANSFFSIDADDVDDDDFEFDDDVLEAEQDGLDVEIEDESRKQYIARVNTMPNFGDKISSNNNIIKSLRSSSSIGGEDAATNRRKRHAVPGINNGFARSQSRVFARPSSYVSNNNSMKNRMSIFSTTSNSTATQSFGLNDENNSALVNIDIDDDFDDDDDDMIRYYETPTKLLDRSHEGGISPSRVSSFNDNHNSSKADEYASFLHHQKLQEIDSSFMPSNSLNSMTMIDEFLFKKFNSSGTDIGDVKFTSEGEFSLVFEVDFANGKYAIKRDKKQFKINSKRISMFQKDREASLQFDNERDAKLLEYLTDGNEALVNFCPSEEIEILNHLKKNSKKNCGSEYIVNYISNITMNNYNYLIMEYCENGSLDQFLIKSSNSKMDEFRIWKILTEVLLGLNFLHENNVLHLDLKPANIFINFEGSLKLGDFGLSAKLNTSPQSDQQNNSLNLQYSSISSAASLFLSEKEGDREYIAPEIFQSQYSQAADIFSLGLIILEIATNIYLPDNGVIWHKLRSGDLSDVGKLSFRDPQQLFLQEQSFNPHNTNNSNNDHSHHHSHDHNASGSAIDATPTSNTATHMLDVHTSHMLHTQTSDDDIDDDHKLKSISSGYSSATTSVTSSTNTTVVEPPMIPKNYSTLTSEFNTSYLDLINTAGVHGKPMNISISNTIAENTTNSKSTTPPLLETPTGPNMTISLHSKNYQKNGNNVRAFIKDGETLDLFVHWMVEPSPTNRPTAAQLLDLYEVQYIELKRRAGATIYEGEIGPYLDLDNVEYDDDDDVVVQHDSQHQLGHKSGSFHQGFDKAEGLTIREYLNGFKSIKDLYHLNKFEHNHTSNDDI